MPRGVLLPDSAEPTPDFARWMGSQGYDSIWANELWGHDAFVTLAAVAPHTDAALGTAIVNVFSRSPAVLAGGAASLSDLASGPIRLGIGPSTPKAIEDLHGIPYDRPVRRLHETAELVRAFTAGEGRVEYDGEVFSVQDFPALDGEVSVYAAALGETSRRATGRTADGWLPHMIPFENLGSAFETVRRTAREAGRDPDLAVSPYVPAAVADDPDEAREAIRGHVAYYVGSGEGYRRAVAKRFPEEAERIAEAWRAGERASAREGVTDEMVDALGVAGTPEKARERFERVAETAPITEPIVVVPSNAGKEMAERTIEELAS
ncbi:LLM class flavin-dependent oxidoreductase [Halalkalicoccus sp. NIPERK01]|uniref:LLM class flavin-dependent oxidoreductase n=1 Tax=Halalkalicoccus sp. NIPERK01 TaxID=3053469 RepID=UPI00256EA0A3|nr:LLM class flavin-dependent oxidoreductase [Halalkalicoccus sp. NIPERK01]MDL5362492.1 LLM class flavin-dependent oxidoreductase [Halalkalicoccus sp. NIPERK01]